MPFLMAYSTPEKYIQWHRAHQKMQKNGIEHIKKYNLWHRAQILIFNGIKGIFSQNKQAQLDSLP
jgi:hypothetical protein